MEQNIDYCPSVYIDMPPDPRKYTISISTIKLESLETIKTIINFITKLTNQTYFHISVKYTT